MDSLLLFWYLESVDGRKITSESTYILLKHPRVLEYLSRIDLC